MAHTRTAIIFACVREVSRSYYFIVLRLDCEKRGRVCNSQRNTKTANAQRDSEHFKRQLLTFTVITKSDALPATAIIICKITSHTGFISIRIYFKDKII